MSVKQYRADVTKTLLALSPEYIASAKDNFSASGTYVPEFNLLDAKNVLPTATGYTSFFGEELDFLDNRPGTVQDIITVRTNTGDTLLVSLNGNDGLFAKSIAGAGTAIVTDEVAIPNPGGNNREKHLIGYRDIKFGADGFSWEELGKSALGSPNPWMLWTHAIVKNNIYFYQAGLGYILHLYGVEKGWVRVDYLEPYFIIGEVDQYRWTFNGVDDNLSCTDTEKSVQIPGLGTFYAFFLDKAHYVKHVKAQWEMAFFALLDLGSSLKTNSYVQQNLEGTVKFCTGIPMIPPSQGPTPPTGSPWLDLDFAYLDIVPFETPISIIYQTPLTNQDWIIESVYRSASGSPPAVGQIANYNSSTSVLALLTDSSTVNIGDLPTTNQSYTRISAKIPVPDNPDPGVTKRLLEYSYSYWIDPVAGGDPTPPAGVNAIAMKFTVSGLYEIVLLDSYYPELGISQSGNIVLLQLDDTPGREIEALLEGTVQKRDTYVSYRNTRLNLGYLAVIEKQVPPSYAEWDPATGIVPNGVFQGTSNNWHWDLYSGTLTSANTLQFLSLEDNEIAFRLRGTLGVQDYTGAFSIYSKIYMQNTGIDAIELVLYIQSLSPNFFNAAGLPFSIGTGIYIGSTLPTNIDENTVGSSHTTTYSAGWRNSGNSGSTARSDKAIVTLQPGEYLAVWIKSLAQADESRVTGPYLFVQQVQGPQAPLPGECTLDESRCITLRHDGQEGELTSSCTPGYMDVGGFKEFDLTSVVILDHDIPIGSFPVYPLMDSNDLWDQLLLELNAALAPDSWAEGTLIEQAQASIDYNLQVTMVDFENNAPVPVLDHDGDCTWTLANTEVEPLKLAAVAGITSARGRLMAWDRLNAIYTSSNQDPLDFTPDIGTQANVGKVQSVQGNIILALPWNNGFILYSTGNIVRAEYTGGTYVFNYNAISDSGIIDVRHITGNFDNHFVFSNKGLLAIAPESGSVEEISPELTDYFNTHPFPLKTSFLGDRYVCLSILARPPGVNIPLVRKGLEDSVYRKGQGLMVPRQTQLLSLRTFPFGSNLFPTYQICMLFDTTLKKWGIGVLPFKSIFSLNPINAKGYPAEKGTNYNEKVYYNYVRSLGGVLENDEVILFNDAPEDSYLCFGHTKFQNMDWSRMKEVTAEFADYANSTIIVEPSSDERTVDWDRVLTSPASQKAINTFYLDLTGAWFNVVIKGVYHLRSFTVKGFPHANI